MGWYFVSVLFLIFILNTLIVNDVPNKAKGVYPSNREKVFLSCIVLVGTFRSALRQKLFNISKLLAANRMAFLAQRLDFSLFFLTGGVLKSELVKDCLKLIFDATEVYPYTHKELFSLLSSNPNTPKCLDEDSLLRFLQFLSHPMREKFGFHHSLKKRSDYYCWSRPSPNIMVTYVSSPNKTVSDDDVDFSDCDENCVFGPLSSKE